MEKTPNKVATLSIVPEKRAGGYTGFAQIIFDQGAKVTVVPVSGESLLLHLKDVYLTLRRLDLLDAADQKFK